MFYSIFLAIFMALACPAHQHAKTTHPGTTVTAQDAPGQDSGGDNGHIPPGSQGN